MVTAPLRRYCEVAEFPLDRLHVHPGAEVAEVAERRLELEIGALVVLDLPQRPGQHDPDPGDLVRRPDLAPALHRGPELLGRLGRGALREEDASQGGLAAGLKRRRRIAGHDGRQLVRGRTRPPHVTGRERDLHLGGQQPGSRPTVVCLLGDRGVDGRGGRLRLALRQADQGEGRLR